MKRTYTKNFALALLAGTAFAFSPAIAQNDAKKPVQAIEGGASTDVDASAGMKGAKAGAKVDADVSGEANANSAAEYAPGQMKKSGEVDSAAEAAPGQQMKSGEVESASEAAPGQMKKSDVSDETTASIDITAEQETELRTVWTEIDTDPVDVDFEVNLGVAVPATVTLQPLPPRVVEIVPAYESYQYFVLADGRIVIVEPATLEIVYIVSA